MTALLTEDVLREEAKAIHGLDLTGKTGKDLNKALSARAAVALCLSGGGIRSGSFALGVMQALAVHPRPAKAAHVDSASNSWLAKFKFLSTVSGGGYIGGWLSAWLFHAHANGGGGWDSVWKSLVGVRNNPIDEPPQVSWLRSYSNFLTPKLGVASADSWAAVALIIRNLLLNWLVIIPVVCLALLVLKLVAIAVAWISQIDARYSDTIFLYCVIAGCLFLIIALRFPIHYRPTRGASLAAQGTFLRWDLAPAMLAAVFFTFAAATGYAENLVHDVLISNGQIQLKGFAALMGIGVAIYAVSWIIGFSKLRRDSLHDWLSWAVSGAVYGGLMATGLYLFFHFATGGFWVFKPAQILLLICGLPWALTSQLLAEMIFVGLTSYQENSDSDREWLGRAAGWYLAFAIVWLLLMTLVFIGSGLVTDAYGQIKTWLVGGGFGTVTAYLGKSKLTPAKGEAKDAKGISVNIILLIAAPITAAALILVTSGLLDIAIFGGSLVSSTFVNAKMTVDGYPVWPGGIYLPLAFILAALIGAVASHFININRFSLHALYRNRIIRAFLGASNPGRHANKFTGFDENDNVRVYDLWPKETEPGVWPVVGANNWRPFHVINMALNVVSTKKLAWQERKAEPFSVSAMHSGSSCVGYRYTTTYGDKLGMTLGTAVAISGAAASPNMGYNSSPPLAFLMTLFNVRLGWWLGNPGPAGENTYQKDGPKRAIVPLLFEMFGQTTEEWRYVYLSDGGHFENLGLYEMVRRRCRYIIVSDGGCDPNYAFEDLGNAVRKISLDLGVTVRFHGLSDLKCRGDDDKPCAAGPDDFKSIDVPFHAIGVIDYAAADGAGEEGIILYVKAGYHKDRIFNAGVRNYAAGNLAFPHESTGDQFFSESQFESYRALGFEIMDDILTRGTALLPDPSHPTLEGVLTALRNKTVSEGKP